MPDSIASEPTEPVSSFETGRRAIERLRCLTFVKIVLSSANAQYPFRSVGAQIVRCPLSSSNAAYSGGLPIGSKPDGIRAKVNAKHY
jgi:hypothetical protein